MRFFLKLSTLIFHRCTAVPRFQTEIWRSWLGPEGHHGEALKIHMDSVLGFIIQETYGCRFQAVKNNRVQAAKKVIVRCKPVCPLKKRQMSFCFDKTGFSTLAFFSKFKKSCI